MPSRMTAPRPSSGIPDAGETLDERRAAQVTRREPVVGVGREDAQLDHAVQLIDADAASLGRLCRVVPLHRRTVRGATAADATSQPRDRDSRQGSHRGQDQRHAGH